LGSKGVDVGKFLDDLIKFNAVGQADIPVRKNPDGSTSITHAQTPGIAVGEVTTINTLGGFFNSTYQGQPLTVDRGKIQGGTVSAQLFILLHELAHGTEAKGFQYDFQDQKMVDKNDKLLEEKCKETIKSFPK
jgi:hypothetical protein